MKIITAREFRENQKKYFDLAEKETIWIMRRKKSPIVISVLSDVEFEEIKQQKSSKDKITT